MKKGGKIQNYIYTAALIAGAAVFLSCRDNIDIINKSFSEDIPTQTAVNFTTTYSDSAIIKLKMVAPMMEYYGKKEKPYSEFTEGITVYFYDESDKPSGQISARFARYYEGERLWEVKDSVVAINERNEMLETELLFWDEGKEQIYTDKFVKITQQDQIIRGYGLESDTRFLKWQIKNVTATLYIEDE